MKNLIVFIIISNLIVGCSAQKQDFNNIDKEHKSKIVAVYNYLRGENKIEENILVVNSIQKLEMEWFGLQLSKNKNPEAINRYNDSLIKKDNLYKHKEFYYPLNKLLDNKMRSSNKIIIFSSTRDNYISAEVFEYEKPVNKYELYGYDFSTMYLFKFKEDGIEKVYDVKIHS